MIPWFQFTTVSIGPLQLQVWGFFVALGMSIALLILYREAKKQFMDAELLLNIAFKIILYGILFARLFHVVFYEPSYFLSNPFEIIAIWHGGLSSFGGLFGAGVALWIFYKKAKIKKEEFSVYLNLLAYASLFGWIVGRIGCFVIHDHLGAPCNSFFAIDSPSGKRLDMALLEIVFLLPLTIVFIILKKKNIQYLFAPLLFVYYGVLRFTLDFWRADVSFTTGDARYFGLTPAQYFAIILILGGIWIYAKKYKRRKI